MKAIFSIGPNGEFGLAGGLCYRHRGDLANFKKLTLGQIVYCGKATAETLPPLPQRTIVTLSRDMVPGDDGWVIGGATVLRSLLKAQLLDTCIVTEFYEPAVADTYLDPALLDYMLMIDSWGHPGFSINTYIRPPYKAIL